MDDRIARSAIAQATRLFGKSVDYCLCTVDHDETRVRRLLEYSARPVEWWTVTSADHPQLAEALQAAGCPPEKFGRWWKWFPERARLRAPEWILDADLVITQVPPWFAAWRRGENVVRATEDDVWNVHEMYGDYADAGEKGARFCPGLVVVPPHFQYGKLMLDVLRCRPLKPGHDGRYSLAEQGVMAAALNSIHAAPIPLCEIPYARAFEAEMSSGSKSGPGEPWGYHFDRTMRGENRHFERLVKDEKIFAPDDAR